MIGLPRFTAAQMMVRVHDPQDAQTSRLPAPVARYRALALDARLEAPERVVLRQSGELKTQPEASRWLPFDAVHTIHPTVPSFGWDARVALWPGIRLRVADAFVDGHGSGRVTLWSLSLARDAANPWIDAGSLHRLLAEAVWAPWALMPGERLRWSALDDRRAVATLSVGQATVSLEFRFAASGEVDAVYSPGRWGRFGGRYEQVAWEGHFGDCRREDRVLVPHYGEVGWYREGRLQLVWKARIGNVTFVRETA